MLSFLYNMLLLLLTPLALLKLRGISANTQGRLAERFGYLDQKFTTQSIVVHGASVGEIIAATPLIKSLKQQFDCDITVTCMTPTGSERALDALSKQTQHCFLPLDLPSAVTRFLNTLQPKAMIIIDTELWPNLLFACKQRKIPVFIVNARISDKSVHNYLRFKSLFGQALQGLQHVFAQSPLDQQRFIKLGVDASKVSHCGNIKLDISIDDKTIDKQHKFARGLVEKTPVLIAASTHLGEDELVLSAFEQVLNRFPNALLILVPRHPQRFDDVANRVLASSLTLVRRSQFRDQPMPLIKEQVLLIDSMGELLSWYGCADAAFIGGSLVNIGGHNPIEAAALSVPVISGPFRQNFREIYTWFEHDNAVLACTDPSSLAEAWIHLVSSPEQAQQQAARASAIVAAQQGALARCIGQIAEVLPLNAKTTDI